MITKEQLQTMSDFEVNKALAGMVYGYPENKDIAKRINSGAIDFCNAPSDIMPMAFEHHLTMHYVDNGVDKKWFATKPYSPDYFHDTAPLRAIACCLILVLQERKV